MPDIGDPVARMTNTSLWLKKTCMHVISTDGVLYFRRLVGGISPTPPEALREEHERYPLAEFLGHHDLKQMISEGYVSEPLDEWPAWIALEINGKGVSEIILKKHSECDILSKKSMREGFTTL